MKKATFCVIAAAGPSNWRYMYATGVIPSVLFFMLLIRVPESSRWLVKNERRRFGDYGFTRRGAFGRLFWEGGLWGLAAIGAVVAVMAAGGGYAVATFTCANCSIQD